MEVPSIRKLKAFILDPRLAICFWWTDEIITSYYVVFCVTVDVYEYGKNMPYTYTMACNVCGAPGKTRVAHPLSPNFVKTFFGVSDKIKRGFGLTGLTI